MGETLRDMGELGFISRLRSAFPGLSGLGDDAAVLGTLSCPVATVDSFVEGRHFHRWWCDPETMGRRLLEATLSDLAAMGAEPGHLLVSLAAPGDLEWEWLSGLYRGFISREDCILAGGETIASRDLTVTLTAIGEGGDPQSLLRRSSMRPGDSLWLTGPVGRALDTVARIEACGGLGGPGLEPALAVTPQDLEIARAFISPRAHFEEARILRRRGVRCAIDISDGLLSEAAHLCGESGVGCEIDLDLVPVFGAVAGRPLEACAAGEDFVLLFSAPSGTGFEDCGFHRIGRALEAGGMRVNFEGYEIEAVNEGYDHFSPALPPGSGRAAPSRPGDHRGWS